MNHITPIALAIGGLVALAQAAAQDKVRPRPPCEPHPRCASGATVVAPPEAGSHGRRGNCHGRPETSRTSPPPRSFSAQMR